MAAALLRACAAGTCPNLVVRGRCRDCERQGERVRGTAHQRGYDGFWRRVIRIFRTRLVAHDVAPVCGARLSGAPATADSQCRASGRLVGDRPGRSLHADHIVPHRGDRQLFRDLLNLQLLCAKCHAEKTLREGR